MRGRSCSSWAVFFPPSRKKTPTPEGADVHAEPKRGRDRPKPRNAVAKLPVFEPKRQRFDATARYRHPISVSRGCLKKAGLSRPSPPVNHGRRAAPLCGLPLHAAQAMSPPRLTRPTFKKRARRRGRSNSLVGPSAHTARYEKPSAVAGVELEDSQTSSVLGTPPAGPVDAAGRSLEPRRHPGSHFAVSLLSTL